MKYNTVKLKAMNLIETMQEEGKTKEQILIALMRTFGYGELFYNRIIHLQEMERKEENGKGNN